MINELMFRMILKIQLIFGKNDSNVCADFTQSKSHSKFQFTDPMGKEPRSVSLLLHSVPSFFIEDVLYPLLAKWKQNVSKNSIYQ